jgi:hypothetical protein
LSIHETIPNLINGISQQPQAIRLSSQCEAQENMMSSVVEGLTKRHPSLYLANITSVSGGTPGQQPEPGSFRIACDTEHEGLQHLVKTWTFERQEPFGGYDYGWGSTPGPDGLSNIAVVPDLNPEDPALEFIFPSTITDLDNNVWSETGISGAWPNYTLLYTLYDGVSYVDSAELTFTMLGEAEPAGAFPWTSPFIHTVLRDSDERYILVVSDGELKVFDLEGNEKVVNAPEGFDYLTTDNPRADLAAVTIQDHTFIVNRKITVALDAETTPARPVEAIVWVKQANFSTDYTIEVNGTEYTKATGKQLTDGATNLKTSDIAKDLKDLLVAALTAPDWSISQVGSTIHIKRLTAGDFAVKVRDSYGDKAMSLAYEKVQHFSDLPNVAPEGFRVEVQGDAESSSDNYWVEFVPNNEGTTEMDQGTWEECAAPGIPFKLDPETMPHGLVREADGTFSFRPFDGATYAEREWPEWGTRDCGDETTAKAPTFVGKTISDVTFWKNRLGFLADSNVILSRAGEYFEFWRETVTTVLDSDPVDVSANHTKASQLHYAVPFSEQLLLFADQTQFVMTSDDQPLTPRTASIVATTSFQASLEARPVPVGPNVYFATVSGGWAGLREYFVSPDTKLHDAANVTAHVPKYIRGTITRLTASDNESALCALSSGDRNTLWVYRYLWQGNEKLQSSWSKFTFQAEILSADFVESSLYMIVKDANGVYLEVLPFDPGRQDEDSDFVTCLDRRLDESQVASTYDAATGTTTFTLPYLGNAMTKVVTRTAYGESQELLATPGVSLQVLSVDGDEVTVRGNHEDTPVFIGETYTSRYVFSTPTLRQQQGNSQVPVLRGRLQIKFWSVAYDDTGYFQTVVTPTYGDAYSYTYSGRNVSSGNAILNQVVLSDGTFTFPVRHRADQVQVELSSDSHLPCRFVQASWEADYWPVSRRN